MKRLIPLILITIAFLTWPHSAFACSTPTHPPGWNGSYEVVSPDGQYVLVMLDGVFRYPIAGVDPNITDQERLLNTYPASGLYRNNGSATPLWTAAYISLKASIDLTSDGRHMVLWGTYPFFTTPEYGFALAFYEDGRLLMVYSIDDLVLDRKALAATDNNQGWVASYSFDEAHGVLNLETATSERYLISLRTGKIVSASIPTAAVRKRVVTKRAVNRSGCPEHSISAAAPISTAVPNADALKGATLPQGDYTLGLGFVISASSLAALFTGLSLLGGKARRKREAQLQFAPVALPLRLKSRARGRKGILRHL